MNQPAWWMPPGESSGGFGDLASTWGTGYGGGAAAGMMPAMGGGMGNMPMMAGMGGNSQAQAMGGGFGGSPYGMAAPMLPNGNMFPGQGSPMQGAPTMPEMPAPPSPPSTGGPMATPFTGNLPNGNPFPGQGMAMGLQGAQPAAAAPQMPSQARGRPMGGMGLLGRPPA
jgi:hypothetical protein